METKFVKAIVDIDCEWSGLPPIYRVYINEEMFSERTWDYTESYLEEILQIQAPPGQYRFRIEPVGPALAGFTVRNHRVEHGPGRWIDCQILEII